MFYSHWYSPLPVLAQVSVMEMFQLITNAAINVNYMSGQVMSRWALPCSVSLFMVNWIKNISKNCIKGGKGFILVVHLYSDQSLIKVTFRYISDNNRDKNSILFPKL